MNTHRLYAVKDNFVEAMRYDLHNVADVANWMRSHGTDPLHNDGGLAWTSPSGLVSAQPGDWVVLDDFGFWHYPPAVFEARYQDMDQPVNQPVHHELKLNTVRVSLEDIEEYTRRKLQREGFHGGRV